MFIRSKTHKGRTYYQVVSSHRKGKKVKQRIEAYLGKHASIEGAIAGLETKVRALRARREAIYRRYFGPKPPEVHRELERSYRQEQVLAWQVTKLRQLAARA